MRMPRFTITRMIILIGVLAVNLAAGRTLYSERPDLLLGIAFSGVAIQFGLFLAIRGRGRKRAFWLGFVLSDAVALASFIGGELHPYFPKLGPDAPMVPGMSGGCPMYGIWHAYIDLVTERLPSLEIGREIDDFDLWHVLDSLDSPRCDLILAPSPGAPPRQRRSDSEIREALLREISESRSPTRAHHYFFVMRSHSARALVWFLPQGFIGLLGGTAFAGGARLISAMRSRQPPLRSRSAPPFVDGQIE